MCLLSVLRIGIIRLSRKAPMCKFNIANYFITKNVGCRPGDDVPNHLNCLNKRLSTPFQQANIAAAAAEGFTELYNGFIEEKICERQRCDFLSYTLFPQLDIDKFLGCPWSELLGSRSDFSKESLLTPRKFLRTNCRYLAAIIKSIFCVWTLMYCNQTFIEFCFHGSN